MMTTLTKIRYLMQKFALSSNQIKYFLTDFGDDFVVFAILFAIAENLFLRAQICLLYALTLVISIKGITTVK